jgi:hypothetical protein
MAELLNNHLQLLSFCRYERNNFHSPRNGNGKCAENSYNFSSKTPISGHRKRSRLRMCGRHSRHRAWLVGFDADMIRLTSKAQGPARTQNKRKQIFKVKSTAEYPLL